MLTHTPSPTSHTVLIYTGCPCRFLSKLWQTEITTKSIWPLCHCSMIETQIIHSSSTIQNNSIYLLCPCGSLSASKIIIRPYSFGWHRPLLVFNSSSPLMPLPVNASTHSHVCRQTTGDYSKYRMLSKHIIQRPLSSHFNAKLWFKTLGRSKRYH